MSEKKPSDGKARGGASSKTAVEKSQWQCGLVKRQRLAYCDGTERITVIRE